MSNKIMQDKQEAESESVQRRAMIRESVERFVKGDSHVRRFRGLRESTPGVDRQVWEQMAGLGWLGTMLPEQYGGLNMGSAEMAIIGEGAGKALLPEPITAGAVFAGGLILYGDNEALKEMLLPAIGAGTLLPAVAWREDHGPLNLMRCDARAEESSGKVRLLAKKCLVIAGVAADGFVVTAQLNEELAYYWVPANVLKSGLSHSFLPDGRSFSSLTLDGLQLSADNRLAGPKVARKAFNRAFDDALLITSAELLGCSSRLLDITVDYLKVRVQFGKPIGSFQALQHRAADLYIQLRICRHSLEDILDHLEQPDVTDAQRSALASRIKARCSDVGLAMGKDAVQMHGAMGYSDECDVGLYLKRIISLAMWLGNSDYHKKRYAKNAIPEIAAYYAKY